MDSRKPIAVYAGSVKDAGILKSCASGGFASAISEEIIRQGGYVAGVVYSNDFRSAEYIVTNNPEDLPKLQGPKYIAARKGTVYQDVKHLLEDGKTVLFIGLPCAVSALYNVVGRECSNLVTCELVCHGPARVDMHRQYLDYLEKRYHSKIRSFSVRYKKNGWLHPMVHAEFANGTVFEKEFSKTEYGYAFHRLGHGGCFHCKFKGDNHAGDMMLGDFWGANSADPFWNQNGVSSAFVYTARADQLLHSLDTVSLYQTTFERAAAKNPMILESRKSNAEDALFQKRFAQRGLIYAVRRSQPLPVRIRMEILALLPEGFLSFVKSVLHHPS